MKQSAVVALGFFDGVHLGHAALLQRARKRADTLGLPAIAMSFHVHPDTLVHGAPVPLLQTQTQRVRCLKEDYGMDEVVLLPFDEAMLQTPWEDFLETVLLGRLRAAWLVCGYDYRFGYRGEGTPEKLRAACARAGLGCDIVDKVELDGQTVSSTRIRQFLIQGEVAKARRFLGHPFELSGRVTHGRALGRRLGTPTANVLPDPAQLLPLGGVYITRAYVAQGSYPAITNIGSRPTVAGSGVTVESWLLDFQGDLYDQPLRLELWEYLRPEQKFEDLSALKTEILKNADQARAYFRAQHGK